ncbi:MAG: CdvA-like protein [Nitrososphaerota archaeon]|nr:CdvA-like protein [Nitrososphaerota archaeon]
MISWKNSFKRLNEEYEMSKKKKQAVDNLYITGKISQFTRDSFNKDISATIVEIERQQKDLVEKMQLKTDELSCQIKTLESLLANYEIQHVIGEIEEEAYQRDAFLLTAGIDAARNELETIKEATMQLCAPVPTIQTPAQPEIPASAATIDTPVAMEYAPTEQTTPEAKTSLSTATDAPVESTMVENNYFEATPTPVFEATTEEQILTTTENSSVVEEPVMESSLFDETSAVVEEPVMESSLFDEATTSTLSDIVTDEPAVEVATTDPVFLNIESATEVPVMDYTLVDETSFEATPTIESPIDETATIEMSTTEDTIAEVPLQVFEVTEQVPVEQTLEKVMEQLASPTVETLTVEELTHDSHPSTAPLQAPSDIITEAISDGQIDESDEDTTE